VGGGRGCRHAREPTSIASFRTDESSGVEQSGLRREGLREHGLATAGRREWGLP
jgi:hypothetical protein